MVFVTGGTGFLGTHLLRELVKRGEKVRALRRLSSRIFIEEGLSNQLEWIEGDVTDIASLEEAMAECDEVYHCAARVSFLPKHYDLIMKVNAEGTANVVNVALDRGIRKLVQVSSVAAIGRSHGKEIIIEDSEWEDSKLNSNYAISKFLAEREVWRGIAEGLNAVIVNPTLIIGSGNWNEGPPKFFQRVRKGLFAYSSGGAGIIAVEDVVNIMIHLMKSDISAERFILNAEHWSFKDFLFSIADQLQARRPFMNVTSWMGLLWREEMLKYYLTGLQPLLTRETARLATNSPRFDHSKIVNATGYAFKPVQQAIEEAAQKFLADEAAGKINSMR